MKRGEVRISATVFGYMPAGACEFDVTVTKGPIKYRLHFYSDVDAWKSFGERLTNFPSHIADQEQIELGSTASPTYLSLCASRSGLKVIMSEEDESPHRCRLEFTILAEVASLNKLGQLLCGWQVEDDSEILWEAYTS